MEVTDIKWLHVEPSSRCNAWCPACIRNNNGFGLADHMVEEDLATERFQEIISQLPNLEAVQFCGNFGDPLIAQNILELIDIAKQHVSKIQIHTNGSLRNETWWTELAHKLKDIDHDVWFGIDGLKGVHEIYRQGTSYEKIIANACAFIQAGGTATWQFIPFAHNEHQIKECMLTSKKLGFKNFKLTRLFRNQTLARHYRTGIEYQLEPPTTLSNLVRMQNLNTQVDEKNCMHLTQPSVYLAASGKLCKCCFFGLAEKFDSLDKLLYNNLNLGHSVCLINCGS